MKTIFIAAVMALVATTAYADPFEGLYGNTATSTSSNGKTYTFFFNADGKFENHNPNGTVVKGTYTWKDARTACFTVTKPPPKQSENATNCRPFPVTHHVGDVWVEKDSNGVAYTNTIKAGR